MLWLPRGIQNFISNKALEQETTSGAIMIDIVTKWCWDSGFTCDHPEYAQKLQKRSNLGFVKQAFFKCLICGQTYQKKVEK